jgi:hypothetical protein
MKHTWKYYSARRGINIDEYLKRNELTTYDKFASHLRSISVIPPLSKDCAGMFATPKPTKETKKTEVAADATATATKPATTNPRKKKTRTKATQAKVDEIKKN